MKRLGRAILCTLLAAGILGTSAGCKESARTVNKRLAVGAVTLEEGMLLDKQTASETFLKGLDADRLLYFFYTTARLPVRNNASPYLGWESANTGGSVAGHTLGHYLSAISMMYRSTGDEWYLYKVNDIVGELQKCQKYNGFLFSRDESDFDAVERGEQSSGVIYYTVHKVLAGLFDAYVYAGNETALQLAGEFMDWIYFRISHLNASQIAAMLLVEYGGMNEIAYQIYEVTQKPEHLRVAETFNEALYLDAWAENRDNLSGKHANTQVPKAVGFAKGYLVTGDQKLLTAAENFWEMVVAERTFATGGNAENEHFGDVGVTSDQIYFNPDETCNIYNMCKLSSYLFTITGEAKYADYMERALLNGLAGSIDENGLKTYYQWLSTDSRKLFHTHDGAFWCCTGTGMETFSKLTQMLAFASGDELKINIFQNAKFTHNGAVFSLRNEDETNTLTFAEGGKLRLSLRVPYYAKSHTLKLNGESLSAEEANGYLTVEREFRAGDVLEYNTEYRVYTESTPDDEGVFALKYGPYLLAAVGRRYEKKNYLAGYFNGGWMSNLSAALEKTADGFVLHTDDFDVPMKKYCAITDEFYTAYFERVDALPAAARTEDFAMRATVSSDLGYDEFPAFPRDHNVWYDYSGSCPYLCAVNDGYVGVNSVAKSPFSNALFDFYVPFVSIPAGEHWLAYDFGRARSVSGISVYFYDNIATITAPKNYAVQYWTGSEWKSVKNQSQPTTKRDRFNDVTFDTVSTTKLRIVLTAEKAAGIIEWKVLA